MHSLDVKRGSLDIREREGERGGERGGKKREREKSIGQIAGLCARII